MTTYIVLSALFIFGFLYNLLIHWLEKEALHESIIPVLVVLWVLATGAAFGILRGQEEMEWLMLCFFASGTWLFIGSYYRHSQELQQRRKDAEEHCKWCLQGEVYDESEFLGRKTGP